MVHAICTLGPTCRLEIMGAHDTEQYRRMARGVIREGRHLWSGLNIPNKKPGEPLLEWAQAVLQECPECDLCVHYSLKHQRRGGDAVAAFESFCQDAAALGVARVLLVTGPKGPRPDAVGVLQRLGRHPAASRLRLGVAFNACLPSEEARLLERRRLEQKLDTGLVEDVWLNTGDDPALLAAGAAFVNQRVARSASKPIALFGSVFLPNIGQLEQFRERPWNGVNFSARYLSSLEGMTDCTVDVLRAFAAHGVEPIVESKVRTSADLDHLGVMLRNGAKEQGDGMNEGEKSAPCEAPLAKTARAEPAVPAQTAGYPARPGRRWGPKLGLSAADRLEVRRAE